ncbi:hypothetical protein LU293_00255 [Moraxella nasovis]|uniref:hypothetical protein n=1 Tax=Moraxella nasovis TaxID=2904121 RepID=UPI001F60D408|nr:hypothetical protein [Moraxella nasovis]UNU73385.1 hypothetical protein LU293_00255 [Moraxella nasovis]
MGTEAYEALVLGIPVSPESEFYKTQQQTFGSAINEAKHASSVVAEHESQIQQKGGLVDLNDLQSFDTGRVLDPETRKSILSMTGESTSISETKVETEESGENRILASQD